MEEILQLVSGDEKDRFAQALTLILNEAMKIEREAICLICDQREYECPVLGVISRWISYRSKNITGTQIYHDF